MPANPFAKAPKGYKSKNVENYETGAYDALGARTGARRYTDDKGRTQYDFSDAFAPIEGAEGVKKSTAGYDFSGVDKAIAGYKKAPPKFVQTYSGATYNPANFKFKSLPEMYGRLAYETGAKNIRRDAAGSLQQLGETMGTRRPGLLMKAAQDSQRGTDERLDTLNNQIRMEEMRKATDLGVQEQLSNADERYKSTAFNADEGYKGFQSRAALERDNAAQINQYLDALARTALSKIGLQHGMVEAERANQDKAMDYLMSMYKDSAGINNQSAQIAAQNRAATLSFLGSMMGAAGSAASGGAFGGKK